ncbi:hypothetical protein PISMIDRAFT_18427 [Pisolithus microcarpus 441]|uniref:Uncharacterized protein n=1 Tax=Pisolithus microcarpus 441 TaxID=765257 RepID=A0A0C9XKL2_9AGAM|nr:hypothetical protein PISMIDRAFT_18427 [Pisolithus microcarpus 441]
MTIKAHRTSVGGDKRLCQPAAKALRASTSASDTLKVARHAPLPPPSQFYPRQLFPHSLSSHPSCPPRMESTGVPGDSGDDDDPPQGTAASLHRRLSSCCILTASTNNAETLGTSRRVDVA